MFSSYDLRMFNIFDYLSNDERCSNIANCIHITHENFMPYTISSTCGTGKDPYDILNSKNEYVFSTELYNYSITFDIRYRYRVEVKNYMIESRINNQGCFWRYPRKFRLLGSNNKRDWKELSNHEGDELSTRGKLISFPVTKNQGIYSSFKLIVDDTVSVSFHNFTGTITMRHLHDNYIIASLKIRKLKPGDEFKALILDIDFTNLHITFTLKESLILNRLSLPKTSNEIIPGKKIHGYIKDQIHGVFIVGFLSQAIGILHCRDLMIGDSVCVEVKEQNSVPELSLATSTYLETHLLYEVIDGINENTGKYVIGQVISISSRHVTNKSSDNFIFFKIDSVWKGYIIQYSSNIPEKLVIIFIDPLHHILYCKEAVKQELVQPYCCMAKIKVIVDDIAIACTDSWTFLCNKTVRRIDINEDIYISTLLTVDESNVAFYHKTISDYNVIVGMIENRIICNEPQISFTLENELGSWFICNIKDDHFLMHKSQLAVTAFRGMKLIGKIVPLKGFTMLVTNSQPLIFSDFNISSVVTGVLIYDRHTNSILHLEISPFINATLKYSNSIALNKTPYGCFTCAVVSIKNTNILLCF